MSTRVLAVPMVREADGLAMSSRNQYLSPREREVAPFLYHELCQARASIRSGMPIAQALEACRQALTQRGFDIDYLDCRSNRTLSEVSAVELLEYDSARLFVATALGKARLIDNIVI